MHVHEDVSEIVQNLDSLGSGLSKSSIALVTSSERVSNVNMFSTFSKNMELYLTRIEKYFESELQMINFLKERAFSLEQKVPSLEIEIQECTALGMTSNVSEMSRTLKKNVQDIADDRSIIEALRSEASEMRNDLIHRLEECLKIIHQDGSNAIDISAYVSVLVTIRKFSQQIELAEDARFNSIIDKLNGRSSTVAKNNGYSNFYSENSEPLHNENSYGDQIEIPVHVIVDGSSPENNSVSNTTPMPVPSDDELAPVGGKKFGWGSTIHSKVPTKSLVDIQKEELSMK